MSTLDRIGNTPLVRLDDIFVKLECANPGGSVKDRVARFLLLEAAARGELRPGDTVVEATSGNTGIAMAMVARELGYEAIIFMPEHMSVERREMIRRLGADVRLTPEKDGFEGPIIERDTFKDKPGHYVPDQFANPDNTRCHRDTTGREMIAQLREQGVDQLAGFVAGVGTGGTLMGVGEALRAEWPSVRIVAVEPEESAVMSGGEAGSHGIMGIGDGFIPDLVDMTLVDQVAVVTTDDARVAANQIRLKHGFCVGMSAGANMRAALKLRSEIGGEVGTIWPDCADRYVSMGLEPPSSDAVTCELKSGCVERTREMLG